MGKYVSQGALQVFPELLGDVVYFYGNVIAHLGKGVRYSVFGNR